MCLVNENVLAIINYKEIIMTKIIRILSIFMVLALMTVSFAGCKNENNESYTESWIEWEEEVGGNNGDTAASGDNNTTNKDNNNNNNTTSGSSNGGTTTVAPVADEKYFPSDWLNKRTEYEKKNPPYNVAKKLKGTTVKFATWIDHTKSEGANAWKTFEKATGIKIEWVNIPQSEYTTKLASMINSGEAPDVFVENNETFPTILKLAQPLNKVSTMDLNDPIWDQSVIKAGTFGNNPYLINTKYSIWNGGDSVYYNKRAFEDNGLLTPQDYIDAGQWTMDNLIKCMTEFKAINSSYNGGALNGQYLAAALGSSLVYMKNGKFVSGVNDAAFTKGMQIYNKMKDNQLLGGNEKGFMDGTTAVYFVGTMGLKKTGVFKGMDPDDLGVAPIPAIDGKTTPKTSAIFRTYGICQGAKNAEGAAYFLRYFLDPLNYDYDTAFMNDDARDYFINNISGVSADQKHFNFTDCAARVFGYSVSERTKWYAALATADSSQFTVELQKLSNEINSAVNKCNSIIDEVIQRDK